jgi:hypothetical protein
MVNCEALEKDGTGSHTFPTVETVLSLYFLSTETSFMPKFEALLFPNTPAGIKIPNPIIATESLCY